MVNSCTVYFMENRGQELEDLQEYTVTIPRVFKFTMPPKAKLLWSCAMLAVKLSSKVEMGYGSVASSGCTITAWE